VPRRNGHWPVPTRGRLVVAVTWLPTQGHRNYHVRDAKWSLGVSNAVSVQPELERSRPSTCLVRPSGGMPGLPASLYGGPDFASATGHSNLDRPARNLSGRYDSGRRGQNASVSDQCPKRTFIRPHDVDRLTASIEGAYVLANCSASLGKADL
jgi:hypothetical protein